MSDEDHARRQGEQRGEIVAGEPIDEDVAQAVHDAGHDRQRPADQRHDGAHAGPQPGIHDRESDGHAAGSRPPAT